MIVTFTDYTPVIRYDGSPWVRARIDEAPSEDGPWTPIQFFTLDPVDDDPENPALRNFTTGAATLTTGWCRVVWLDDASDESESPPVQNVQVVRDWRPLVSDVGELIRTRTIDTSSNELGTFTEATRPTYEQASRIVDQAVDKLEAKFGPVMKAELEGAARTVVALRAAMLIELSFFGEQIAAGRSPYPQLYVLYEEALKDWDLARLNLGKDDTPDTPDDTGGVGLPAYCFPSLVRRPRREGIGGPDGFFDENWPGRFGL